MFSRAAAALPAVFWLTAAAAAAVAQQPPSQKTAEAAPRREVRLAIQLTRINGEAAAAAAAAPQVIGSPVLNAFDGGTGSISLSGGDIGYSVSLSPTLESDNSVALLYNVRLSGRALPGATSVTLTGASRAATGRSEPVTEVTLREGKTGKSSTFRLSVTATIKPAPDGAPRP